MQMFGFFCHLAKGLTSAKKAEKLLHKPQRQGPSFQKAGYQLILHLDCYPISIAYTLIEMWLRVAYTKTCFFPEFSRENSTTSKDRAKS